MDSEVVTGLEDLSKRLTELPQAMQKKVLRGALRSGMKLTLARARSAIHDRTGTLSKSLRLSTRLGRDGVVRATVKAGGKDAYYAHMVEFGTAAHVIAAKNGKALVIGGTLVDKVDHPGAHAAPFMRPALDAAAIDNSEVFQAVAAYLAAKLNEQLGALPDETDTTDQAQ